jgi:hypothetical protein
MKKDGFELFNFNPASLNKHEARNHNKAPSSFWLLSFVKFAAIAILVILIILRAGGNVGRVKLES